MKREIQDFFINSNSDKEKVIYIISKNIGKKIKSIRLKYNMKGSELARVIGISQQQLSKYENGKVDITTSKIILISIYFDIDINYFFINEN
ncbi:helix-turn-helix domain-containing protein [Providencia rettgeri]|nr:helix-turn-helix transcriptional regulator [Providencia rettgeri]